MSGASRPEFDTISAVVQDVRDGKMVIVLDDEDRENVGDFILAAEKTFPEDINFLIREGRGVVCVPITAERARALGLDSMVETNTSLHQKPFTVSVDYLHGTTTGVSAADRAATVRALVDSATKSGNLGRPGHIFPLRTAEGGVLPEESRRFDGIGLEIVERIPLEIDPNLFNEHYVKAKKDKLGHLILIERGQ